MEYDSIQDDTIIGVYSETPEEGTIPGVDPETVDNNQNDNNTEMDEGVLEQLVNQGAEEADDDAQATNNDTEMTLEEQQAELEVEMNNKYGPRTAR